MGFFRRTKARPDASDVATRAIILKHVAVHSLMAPPREVLEETLQVWSAADRAQFAKDVESQRDQFWKALGALGKALSPWEQDFSRSTALDMSLRQQMDAGWRIESFQALAWALGVIDALPAYDVEADHDILKTFPPGGVERFIETARLRPQKEIDEARGMAELWHWRSRTRQLIERGDAFPASPEMRAAGVQSYDDIVRLAASKAEADGKLGPCVDGDFPAFGKAYRDLAPDEWAQIGSITVERHFALNWLCGHAPAHRWDDTPTDT